MWLAEEFHRSIDIKAEQIEAELGLDICRDKIVEMLMMVLLDATEPWGNA